jgi:ribosomal protein S6 kinase alpha-5
LQTVDWWSLGVLTFELLTGTSPFSSENSNENTQSQVSQRILKNEPRIPSRLSSDVRDLIRRLLEKNPQKRLGARGVEEIKKHKFFRVSPELNSSFLCAGWMVRILRFTSFHLVHM